MKILLVDDEPAMLDVMADLLADLGHETVTVSNGMRALEALDREPLRVVITDWMMPTMDGLELVRRIRASGRQRYVYVIMLTALAGPEKYLEGMRAGADDFVSKPISIEELEVRLRVAERIIGLQENVRLLEGILSICMYCKKVRASEAAWTSIEHYVEQRSDASFSHDVCPACYESQVAPELRALEPPPE
ncbi:MAG: response regulator transcription factor [Candidatus Rokubacteria bacterium]|nr:response regulator transcription factor [Candidatus Rokubacteria bacterium]